MYRQTASRKRIFFLFLLFLSLWLIFASFTPKKQYRGNKEPVPEAKNIILMVGDGMGLAHVTAARIFKNGPDGESLYLETLPTIGYQRTHSASDSLTDSAAAASAWANGEKFNNGEISCHDDDQDGRCEPAPSPTILEIAKAKGKVTGLVVTSTVTHATPAAFGSHVPSRRCEKEIARQYIQVTEVDVILGGGRKKFKSTEKQADECGTFGDFIADAKRKGYQVVYTKKALDGVVAKGSRKILGLFTPKGKTPELFRLYPEEHYQAEEPTLPHMTAAALEIVERAEDGFFLLVEGSQIDWASHRNDVAYQIGETLAFDEAVKVVLNWINEKPNRRHNTLVIISADHETGGFAISSARGRKYKRGDIV
ncbi:MAG: alkaline phosphatase, partial [Deltaproteobacteria bacterium]|nr:alkaline phosphatase [Deltaproteobacteria bacterium]